MAACPFPPLSAIIGSGKAVLSPTGLRRSVLAQEHSIIDRATGIPSPTLTLPARIKLESLSDDRLRVKAAIEVVLTVEGGQIIAAAEGLDEFGFGDNLPAAIADLQHSLADLYLTLAAEQDHLGKGLRRVWAVL